MTQAYLYDHVRTPRGRGKKDGALHEVPTPEPAADDVVVRIEATPINPSDIGLLFGAADTFRAAAIEQLDVWGQRAGVPVIKRDRGSDPASVCYDVLDEADKREILDKLTPAERMKPSSARVGWPSASTPLATAGPFFSIRRSGCRVATSVTISARRRGVA